MKTDDHAGRASPDVPESIKRHAPRPVLRPDGSWRAMADAVDRTELENADAEKARQKWAARISSSRKLRLGFRMARDDQ